MLFRQTTEISSDAKDRLTIPAALRATPRPRAAFTLVELIVVIVVIAIILAIGIPALSNMITDARFNAAVENVSAALNRAQMQSIANMNLTAVRFVPSGWDVDPKGDAASAPDRQAAVTYAYGTEATAKQGKSLSGKDLTFSERFARDAESRAVILPSGVWAAPAEALTRDTNGRAILTGTIGQFELSPLGGSSEKFLEADDFLVVFEPQSGLRPSDRVSGFRLKAQDFTRAVTDPKRVRERDDVYRSNFTGVVLYKRDPFLALGTDAKADLRQEIMRRDGRPYFVNRYGGGLVMGTP
ncbi:MAG: hypothetical protein CHACPFDD_01242 [Phycisphaerae bacterium]|nr:hypothetical protein [Phycisphaerae bacterium]